MTQPRLGTTANVFLIGVLLTIQAAIAPASVMAASQPDGSGTAADSANVVIVDRRSEPSYQAVDGFAQDAQGFVWLATRSGPVRFNGRFYDTFATLSDDLSPISEPARDIVAHPERGVWIATGTVRHLDPWSGACTDHQVQAQRIVGADNVLWTWHEGAFSLYDVSNGQLAFVRSVPFTSRGDIDELPMVSIDGNLYVGDGIGVTTISTEGNLQTHAVPSGVTGLTPSSSGGVWLASPSGLWSFEGDRRPQRATGLPDESDDVRGNPTAGIVERYDGRVWIGFDTGYFEGFDPTLDLWSLATEVPNPAGTVTAAFEDSFGGLWIGRSEDRVDRLSRAQLIEHYIPLTFEPTDDGREPGLLSIAFTRSGALLATTDMGGGLQRYSAETRSWNRVSVFDPVEEGDSPVVPQELNSFVSTTNFDWLVTQDDGLFRVNPFNGHVDTVRLADSSGIGRAVADDFDRVWIAGPGFGVQALSEAAAPIHHFSPDTSPPIANLIADAIWADEDRVLIGGDAGLESIDLESNRVVRFNADAGTLHGRSVNSIHVDPTGAIWLATSAGLEKIDPGATQSTMLDSFQFASPGSAHTLTAVDDGRRLWVGGAKAIVLVDIATSDLVGAFGSADGLPDGAELIQMMDTAPSGATYVAGTSGIVQLTPNPQPPRAAPEIDLYVRCASGCVINGDGEISLNASEARFEFDAASSITGTGLRVEYSLQGADTSARSTEIGGSSVLYQDLQPGDYELQAAVVDIEGQRIAELSTLGTADALTFQIRQSWWRSDTGRFILFILGVAIVVTFLALNQRTNRQRQLQLEATVSERTLALDEARHAAEQALTAKSNLMSQVSHELRSPLMNISGSAELLLLDELSTSQRQHVATIVTSGGHLASLIDDLLDLGVRDGAAFPIRLGSVDVCKLVESVATSAQSRAAGREIDIRSQVGRGLRGRYITDERRLRQALSNLINNAIAHTDATGIIVSVQHVPREEPAISAAPLGETLRFAVLDNAGSFDSAQFGRLIEAFERTERGRQTSGLGLGLAITSGIVRRFGSTLDVVVEPGKTTAFSFDLILQHPVRGEDPPTIDLVDGNSSHTRRALIVDDEAMVRSVLAQMLAHLGWIAIEASNGSDALRLVDDFQFDLVLTDLMMAPVPGTDLATELRQRSDIPIIAVTGAGVPSRGSFDVLLHKPVSLADLTAAIASVDNRVSTKNAELRE